jgi:hypothetical protein
MEEQKGDFNKIVNATENTFIVMETLTGAQASKRFASEILSYNMTEKNPMLKISLERPVFIFLILKHDVYCQDLRFYAVLHSTWMTTQCAVGDKVNIIGQFRKGTQIIFISDYGGADSDDHVFSNNIIILEPDYILHPTAITMSLPCYRKVILSQFLQPKDEGSCYALQG